MRGLRYLIATVLVLSLTHLAKAEDYGMVVVDPTPTVGEITYITSPTFDVMLSPCQSNQLDGLSTSLYLGCFTGLNISGQTLDSLEILIPIFDINGVPDTPTCPQVTQDAFTNTPVCGTTTIGSKTYTYVDVSGGPGIPTAVNHGDCDYDGDAGSLNQDDINCDTASIFTIAVGLGTDCGTRDQCSRDTTELDTAFNDAGAVATAATPEPSPILLTSTGIFSLALFGLYQRRQRLSLRLSPNNPR